MIANLISRDVFPTQPSPTTTNFIGIRSVIQQYIYFIQIQLSNSFTQDIKQKIIKCQNYFESIKAMRISLSIKQNKDKNNYLKIYKRLMGENQQNLKIVLKGADEIEEQFIRVKHSYEYMLLQQISACQVKHPGNQEQIKNCYNKVRQNLHQPLNKALMASKQAREKLSFCMKESKNKNKCTAEVVQQASNKLQQARLKITGLL